MKQVTNMSRLVNQLEKTFRLLNQDFFNNELPMPIITVIPSTKSYAHYVPYDVWNTKEGGKREINISSAYLLRPLENIIGSLLHECCHFYNDVILNVQDCSRGGMYHNRQFKKQAEQRGLIVERSEKYGFAHTMPSDTLIEWVLNHNELRDIEICRNEINNISIGIGKRTADGSIDIISTNKSHSRRYICPCCHTIIRATKTVNVICGDCMQQMIER